MKKGQGTTEYLLILAIVLVIVAVVIVHVMAGGGGKPAVAMSALYDSTDNAIELIVTSGIVPKADWQYRILVDSTVDTDWTDGAVDIDPRNSPITLKSSPSSGNYTVQIYHGPSKSSWPDMAGIIVA